MLCLIVGHGACSELVWLTAMSPSDLNIDPLSTVSHQRSVRCSIPAVLMRCIRPLEEAAQTQTLHAIVSGRLDNSFQESRLIRYGGTASVFRLNNFFTFGFIGLT